MAESPRLARLATASIAGTMLEYYDFAVYNTLAALVFNKLFFPSFDPLSGTILAFSTFAVGYLSRPIGGLVFGHLGDRRGRRFVLVATLLLMGITTVLIGVLPTYAVAGATAPVLLVALRFVQGAALGGEWAGAVLLSAEHGEAGRRGRNASWAQMGPSLGTLLATGVVALVTTRISSEEFLAWGWRLPFFLSGVLVVFGLWVRIGVAETPSFRQLARDDAQARAPVAEVFREHWRRLLIAAGVRIGPDVLYSLTAIFALSYLTTTLGVERPEALIALSIGGVCNALTIPLFGAMSDRFGRRSIYGIGVLCALALAFAFFPLLQSESFAAIALALAAALTVHAMMYGPQAAFITEQFPARVRYAGSSLAYTLAGVLGGGIAPLMFATLHKVYGTTTPLAIYLVVALLVTAVALAVARGGTAGTG